MTQSTSGSEDYLSYDALLSASFKNVKTPKALEMLGSLIDQSADLRNEEGLRKAIQLSAQLQKRKLTSEHLVTLYFFTANAWTDIRHLSGQKTSSWDWEHESFENEIILLRKALRTEDFDKLPSHLQYFIFNKLGKIFDEIGRFVEAIDYWNRAIAIDPSIPHGRGHRGLGYYNYQLTLYDPNHKKLFLRMARDDIEKSLAINERSNILPAADKKVFRDYLSKIGKYAPEKCKTCSKCLNGLNKTKNFPENASNNEIKYRKWCLEKNLFLNPLNDLWQTPAVAKDILTTPNISVDISTGPQYPAFYNQLKQEFVSARYLFYEATVSRRPHFSDRETYLYNTLDYPAYSLTVEKMKDSYRAIYSLLDKIAFFLNDYLKLGMKPRNVSFRKIWLLDPRHPNLGLREEFKKRKNWSLRGLFWLSKDLYEDKPGFKRALALDAQELATVRNRLEHRYFKLHEQMWVGKSKSNAFDGVDSLSYSMYRSDFEAKTLKLFKLVRAALIYLSLGLHTEEYQRSKSKKKGAVIPMPLEVYDDDWKI